MSPCSASSTPRALAANGARSSRPAVDGDLVGGAGALDVPLLDEQLPEGLARPVGRTRG